MKHQMSEAHYASPIRTRLLIWMVLSPNPIRSHADHTPPTVYWHGTLNSFVRWDGNVIEMLRGAA